MTETDEMLDKLTEWVVKTIRYPTSSKKDAEQVRLFIAQWIKDFSIELVCQNGNDTDGTVPGDKLSATKIAYLLTDIRVGTSEGLGREVDIRLVGPDFDSHKTMRKLAVDDVHKYYDKNLGEIIKAAASEYQKLKGKGIKEAPDPLERLTYYGNLEFLQDLHKETHIVKTYFPIRELRKKCLKLSRNLNEDESVIDSRIEVDIKYQQRRAVGAKKAGFGYDLRKIRENQSMYYIKVSPSLKIRNKDDEIIETYQSFYYDNPKKLDYSKLEKKVDKFMKQSLLASNGKKVEPNQYVVLLGPYAADPFIHEIIAHFASANRILQNFKAYDINNYGKRVANKNLTIKCVPYIPGIAAFRNFDHELLDPGTTVIIDRGKFVNVLCDMNSASKWANLLDKKGKKILPNHKIRAGYAQTQISEDITELFDDDTGDLIYKGFYRSLGRPIIIVVDWHELLTKAMIYQRFFELIPHVSAKRGIIYPGFSPGFCTKQSISQVDYLFGTEYDQCGNSEIIQPSKIAINTLDGLRSIVGVTSTYQSKQKVMGVCIDEWAGTIPMGGWNGYVLLKNVTVMPQDFVKLTPQYKVS